MRMDTRYLAFIALLSFLCGCAAQPQTPPLEGTLVKGVYRAKGGRFTITLPSSLRDHTRYIQITEQYGTNSSIVHFGPAVRDDSVFRLEVLHKTSLQARMVKLKNIAPPIVDGLVAQMTHEYNARPVLDYSEAITIAGHEAMHWRYYQTVIPATANNPRLYQHEIYIINFPDDAAVIWAQSDPSRAPHEPGAVAQQFASSLAFE